MAAASPSAFGAAAAADATLHVPRGAAAKGIGPGAFVSTAMVTFGKDWAKKTYPKTYKTARAYGTVKAAAEDEKGQKMKAVWLVDYTDGTSFNTKTRQLRLEKSLPDTTMVCLSGVVPFESVPGPKTMLICKLDPPKGHIDLADGGFCGGIGPAC